MSNYSGPSFKNAETQHHSNYTVAPSKAYSAGIVIKFPTDCENYDQFTLHS